MSDEEEVRGLRAEIERLRGERTTDEKVVKLVVYAEQKEAEIERLKAELQRIETARQQRAHKHALLEAKRRAEIERLERLTGYLIQRAEKAEADADRLAKALQILLEATRTVWNWQRDESAIQAAQHALASHSNVQRETQNEGS